MAIHGEDWEDGSVIEMFDEQYTIIKNYGLRGTVSTICGTEQVNNFYWSYQGEKSKLISTPAQQKISRDLQNMKITTIKKINASLTIDSMPDEYFKPVINGIEQNVIGETEDIALILGLAIKYDGHNSQFAKNACRMLGIESAWAD